MNETINKDFLSVFLQLGGIASLMITLFYLHYQNRQERVASDNRWAELKTNSDNRWATLKSEGDERWARLLVSFTDFKNVTVSRFADIDKTLEKNQDSK